MQRISIALIALLAALLVNTRPVNAQTGQAVEPTSAPQEINERSDGTTVAPAVNTPPAPNAPAAPAAPGTVTGAFVVRAEDTLDNLGISNRPLVIQGHITHDVVVTNSAVTLEPGGKVDGTVTINGGKFDNPSNTPVHVVFTQGNGNSETLTTGLLSRSHADTAAVTADAPTTKNQCFGQQMALLLAGLLGSAFLLVVAPRATQRVSAAVTFEPGRCLAVGAVGAAGLVAVQIVNAGIHKAFGIVWAPFHFLVATATLAVLAFGWLCGMRYAGDMAAHKLGRGNSGSLYGRMALGLGAFFVADALLGGISPWLGGVGMCVQAGFALMGLGAFLTLGFGKAPGHGS